MFLEALTAQEKDDTFRKESVAGVLQKKRGFLACGQKAQMKKCESLGSGEKTHRLQNSSLAQLYAPHSNGEGKQSVLGAGRCLLDRKASSLSIYLLNCSSQLYSPP